MTPPFELPLHPALVHLPLGLAAAMPLLILLVLGMRTLREGGGAFLLSFAQVLVLGGAIASLRTGEEAEEVAEEVVSHDLIHEHEELAEQFTVLAGITLLSLLAAAVVQHKGLGGARAATGTLAVGLGLSILTAGQGVRTGHEGGELVFEHGAGVNRSKTP
jgi:uncharacterized membrane protein